jgi:hypothetical protein
MNISLGEYRNLQLVLYGWWKTRMNCVTAGMYMCKYVYRYTLGGPNSIGNVIGKAKQQRTFFDTPAARTHPAGQDMPKMFIQPFLGLVVTMISFCTKLPYYALWAPETTATMNIELFNRFFPKSRRKLLRHILQTDNEDSLRQVSIELDMAKPTWWWKRRAGKPKQKWTQTTSERVWQQYRHEAPQI